MGFSARSRPSARHRQPGGVGIPAACLQIRRFSPLRILGVWQPRLGANKDGQIISEPWRNAAPIKSTSSAAFCVIVLLVPWWISASAKVSAGCLSCPAMQSHVRWCEQHLKFQNSKANCASEPLRGAFRVSVSGRHRQLCGCRPQLQYLAVPQSSYCDLVLLSFARPHCTTVAVNPVSRWGQISDGFQVRKLQCVSSCS